MKRLTVHLVGGEAVPSRAVLPSETTEAEWSELKDFISSHLQSGDAWHLRLDLDRPGAVAIIAGSQVQWVEIQE